MYKDRIIIKSLGGGGGNGAGGAADNKNEHLEGYWSLVTYTFEELDIKPVIDDLLRKLEGKLEIIKEICKENNGEVCFEIVPIFEKDNLPAIYFEKRFLNIVNYLDAVIDIDMYLN